MRTKKVIILNHNGGRLANQLWLFASVYTYCLEKGYVVDNQSFFEYAPFFNVKSKSFLINSIFYNLYNFLKIFVPIKLRGEFYHYVYKIYCFYVKKVEGFNINSVVFAPDSNNHIIHYLLPTKNSDHKIDEFESSNNERELFLDGWMFRNPVGLNKYHKQVIDYFRPKTNIWCIVESFVSTLRNQYKNVVGVHIRQGDYKSWMGGDLYFSQDKIKKQLDEMIVELKYNSKETVFILCSDGQIDLSFFSGLNTVLSIGGVVEDMFVLALTDVIIGSDSTFGAFASYYGNTPFIVFNNNIDWGYYLDKKEYFENKYSTCVHY